LLKGKEDKGGHGEGRAVSALGKGGCWTAVTHAKGKMTEGEKKGKRKEELLLHTAL